MLYRKWALLLLLFTGGFAAAESIKIEPTHGELLYATGCLECHKEQVHWRGNKSVKDWESLIVEVQRWQKYLSLGWSQYDNEMVARYLNAMHYHYPPKDR